MHKSCLTIMIPYLPPGINSTYKTRKGGGIYKSREAKKWQRDAALLIGAKAAEIEWEDHGGDFELLLSIHNSRCDVDAYIKIVQDTVAEKLNFDDKRICRTSAARVDDKQTGITIRLVGV